MVKRPFQALLLALAALAIFWTSESFVEPQRPGVERLTRGLTCRRGVAQIHPDRYARDSPEYEPRQTVGHMTSRQRKRLNRRSSCPTALAS